jgi:hypothetical protein
LRPEPAPHAPDLPSLPSCILELPLPPTPNPPHPRRTRHPPLRARALTTRVQVWDAIGSVSGGADAVSTVALEWSEDAMGVVRRSFTEPAWLSLTLAPLLWPLWLSAAWVVLTLGSCVLVPRLRCHQPHLAWPLYVGAGCPSCWSEVGLLDD